MKKGFGTCQSERVPLLERGKRYLQSYLCPSPRLFKYALSPSSMICLLRVGCFCVYDTLGVSNGGRSKSNPALAAAKESQ